MAHQTGVFREKEIVVLGEIISDMLTAKESAYRVISEEVDGKLVGYLIFGRTPLTDFGWDIYWLVVDKAHQGTGLGKKLLAKAEEKMFKEVPRAIIRVETSSRKEYLLARRFYVGQGFREVGLIDDFYSNDDGIVIYSKDIIARKP
ncbi:MAG: N-acetyltransferase [Candidatus Omnitrophica bacterium]|nr:N-acetyltransferase [Candidatus Omnitrophota bacterium]MDD5488281.1 N-acetyltransferase [Candidatus Omnitrophota bacterium]